MAAGNDTFALGLARLWYSRHPAVRLLWPLSALIAALVGLRRILYSVGFLRSFRVAARVVVVGNITAGGTGKTPVVLWLCRALTDRGLRVGVAGSGYGGTHAGNGGDRAAATAVVVTGRSDPVEVGDEAVLIARKCRCPVAICRDRVAAARLLVERFDVDVVVCDDGLQHLRLRRDFEIVVVDGERGFGNGLCLPFGPLREPVSRLVRSDAIIVNGSGADGTPDTARVVGGEGAVQPVLRCRMVPGEAVELASGRSQPIGAFAGRAVHAVAAIGNPERFFGSLRAQGLEVDGHAYRDHAVLDRGALSFRDESPVLVTEKDAIKIESTAPAGVWAIAADLEFADAANAATLVASIATDADAEAIHV